MKALTICQPYAELIARGEKIIENRTWFTGYRGPLLIHAGKSRAWLDGDTDADLEEEFGRRIEFGAIVAKCTLVACIRSEEILRGDHDDMWPQLSKHPHVMGPWCFVLRDVERLAVPVPYRGAQGLFDVPEAGA